MKKALLIALFLAGPALGSGSRNSYADPKLNDEFDNVYFQIGSVLKGPLRISSMTVTSLNVSTISVVGVTDGTDACTGCVGEAKRSQVGSTNFPASGQWGDLTSISITAGDWDITAGYDAAASVWTNFQIGISTTTGNSGNGLNLGDNWFSQDFTGFATPPARWQATVPTWRLSATESFTVYLKFMASYVSGTPTARGRISARRVR